MRNFTRWGEPGVVLAATLIALGSAVPFASSSNDASRLATVDSLVDRHTLAIDDSIYVPPRCAPVPGRPPVYNPEVEGLDERGTGDKVRINGHFYSDKPPVPAILLAGLYALLQALFGLRAATRPDVFCYLMTIASSGVAYVAGIWCVYRLAGRVGLSPPWQVALAASLGLSTVALPYVRQVNGHILILPLAAGALLALLRWEATPDRGPSWLLALIGGLVGFAYAIEQPTGGLLAAGLSLIVAWRGAHRVGPAPGTRPFSFTAALVCASVVVAGALPWALFHHGVTYAYAGKFGPPNADPAAFDYPGAEFDATQLTGIYNHESVGDLALYSLGLLFNERGFMLSDLPLFLAALAPFLLPWRLRFRPEVLFCYAWPAGTWLVFALLSNNYSGWCVSIRWFVPLLASGYFLLALLLHERPELRVDFLVLSFWGAVLGWFMWQVGTWHGIVPYLWDVQGAALATWLGVGRAFPSRVERWARALATPLWLLAVAAALVVLAFPGGPFDLPSPRSSEVAVETWAALLVLLGLLVGVRARADCRPWLTLGLAFGAGQLFVALRSLDSSRAIALLVLAWAALWALSRVAVVATGAARSR